MTHATKIITHTLIATSLLLMSAAPALAADTTGPSISVVTPLSAQYFVPQTYRVTASDVSSVFECRLLVSSIYETPMMYNAVSGQWQTEYTFVVERTANSIRAVCTDTLGNETKGPSKIISVSHVPTEDEADATTGMPAPEAEVDVTGWTREDIIKESPVLIKTVCPGGEDVNHPCRTVYFLDDDGFRHAFPNEKAYFTWYDAFLEIHLVTDSTMASYFLAGNVTYHPGKKLVKFPSVPTVYAVARYGELRPIASEPIARELYGDDWAKKVDDVSEAFYGNYTIGAAVTAAADFDVDVVLHSVNSINDNIIPILVAE